MEDYRETERRRNGGTIFNEPYSDEAIYRFKHLVQQFYQRNERKFYSILVDGETVIKKTSDSRKFDGFQDFINDYTKKVEVRIYLSSNPHSPNCNRYIFRKAGVVGGIGAVGGTVGMASPLDVKSEIKKALKKQRQEFEIENLKNKVENLQDKLEKAPKVDWNNILGHGAGFVSMLTGKRNPLNGISKTQNNDTEITVEAEPSDQLNQAQKLFNGMVKNIGLEKMVETLEALSIMANHPDIMEKVDKLLTKKKKKNGEA